MTRLKLTLTFERREELVHELIRRPQSVRAICRRYQVCRQTAYKYLRRFRAHGRPGLGDQRRGRRRKHLHQWEGYRRWILRARRWRGNRGAEKLLFTLRQRFPRRRLPSVRTVERWLAQAGQTTPRPRRRPPLVLPLRTSGSARCSNAVWSLDHKGWRLTADRQKIEPLTVRDVYSRFLLWNRPLRRRAERALRGCCEKLFRRYGLPRMIRTDLGPPFYGPGPYGLTTLSLWWHRLGIKVQFVRRGGGLHNNDHEQMHAVLESETMPAAATRPAQLRRLDRFRTYYNHGRPHRALGNRTPAECYRAQPAALAEPPPPSYPTGALVRRVGSRGMIVLHGLRYYIGRAFGGLNVGCFPRSGSYRVFFADLRLGELRAGKISRGP